jgi:eukaryotic-like serine/threonine-protein kinase
VTSWSGRSIAHYRVGALVGVGGMGEVYRASDPRLGRDVAMKLLPPAFATDADRMARFEREAKLLAALSHPNIAAIFGLEEAEGTRALVMEMVEGPTLADLLAQGALPVDEALGIAAQVAEALEYAHERGIVHRDLKPANVKLTAEGKAKVLDFGLAKALSDDPFSPTADLAKSPTLTVASTKAGMILGTAAYMSPEQAKGKLVDRRADIWSFGALLYEMLTARMAFAGETTSEILAAILKDEPDWSALPAATPAVARELMRRCLQKDPRQRLRDIGEARIALEGVLAGGMSTSILQPASGAPGQAGAGTPPARRISPLVAAAIALVLAAAGGLVGYQARRSVAPPMFSASLPIPDGMHLDLDNASLALSPDGRTLVLAAIAEQGQQQLWIRRLDGDKTTPLAGTTGASYPFWSPDGRYIGFFADRKLKKIPVGGGVPQTICDAVDGRGGSWSRDGRIVFAPGPLEGLRIVSASGGESQSITTLEKAGATHRLPHFLPDGKRLLFFHGGVISGDNAVDCLNVDSKKRTPVLQGDSEAWYLDPGYLGFVRDGTLMVQRFDPKTLRLAGDPVPMAEGVQFNTYRYTGNYTMAARGPLLYVVGSIITNGQLTWFSLEGTELQHLGDYGQISEAKISPDGRRVMTTIRDPHFDLWMYEVGSGIRTRFTLGPAPAAFPCWTPDGRSVVYGDGTGTVWRKPLDGSGGSQKVISMPSTSLWPGQVTPDGREVILFAQQQGTGMDIWSVPLAGPAEPRKLFETPASEQAAAVSPDGKWIAIASDESGKSEIYVLPYPSLAGRWQVSNDGGLGAEWLPNGRGLVYTKPDQHVVQVDLETSGGNVTVGATRALFGGKSVPGPWTLSPDGSRFLVILPEQGAGAMVSMVTDWRAMVAAAAR